MRIQTMILPGPGDDYEWILVLDEVGTLSNWTDEVLTKIAARVGAKTVLVFAGSVEVL